MALSLAAPSSDTEMLTFIVKNIAAAPPSSHTPTLAADDTLQALHEKVAAECQLVPGTFELSRADGTAYRLTDDRADVRKLGLEP